MYWVLDFDDTLALGPNTWAFQTVLPDLIQKYQLPFDAPLFDAVTLKAQEQANLTDDEESVVRYVFEALNWDISLKDELINRVYHDYQPQLFDDTLDFLEHRAQHNDTLLVVSNNNYAGHLLEQLGIAHYFKAVFTPKLTQKRAKPRHEMWSDVQAIVGNSVVQVVGDDPWSDGLFSQGHPQAQAWIIDRLERYTSLHGHMPYHFVTALTEIAPKTIP